MTPEQRRTENNEQWKYSLIGKFLGKCIRVSCDCFISLLENKGSFEIILMGNKFVMLKFNIEEDKLTMKDGGLWRVPD